MPSLNSLRAFEAAARHLSYTRAAEELSVTTAAISHQIKALEEYLDITLVKRNGRGIALTDAGRACLPALSDGFARLAEAVDVIRSRTGSGPLTIRATSSFASKWLVPRLDRFTTPHTEIDVRVSASRRPVDFSHEDVDLAIIYGDGQREDVHLDLLMRNEVFPVCTPKLLEGPHPLNEPADLRFHHLLHHDSPNPDDTAPDWGTWLKAAGVADQVQVRGPHFDRAALVIDECVAGHGVGLARSSLVADDLRAGRLVRPFSLSIPVKFAYYLVMPSYKVRLPKVAAFREWILAEAKSYRETELASLPPAVR
ncbi:MAG: transcriptional regulator GcvA [Acetobacterales bacterium]